MKCLTITVDDRVLFSGDVIEVQWSESDQKVSVTGQITNAPSFLEQIGAAVQAAQQSHPQALQQLSHSDSLDESRELPPRYAASQPVEPTL